MALSTAASAGLRVLSGTDVLCGPARVQVTRSSPAFATGTRSSAATRTPFRAQASACVTEVEDASAKAKAKPLLEDAELDAQRIPSHEEIEAFLTHVCDETSIAEVVIKVGGFKLAVKRKTDQSPSAATVPATIAAAPISLVPSPPMVDTLAAVGSFSAPYPAPAASGAGSFSANGAEQQRDEGLVYVTSPKVGFFRKNKGGRPATSEGATVKAGQVVGYIEQLGTQFGVEADSEGEVISYLAEDGDAVGFGDALLSIRPAFPGIKLSS